MYLHCPQCHKRMVRIAQDRDGRRSFYLCRNDGERRTFVSDMNGMSDDWPAEIFDQAVKDRVITKSGKLVAS